MANNFGRITINGKDYIERFQVFPFEVTITTGLAVLTQQRIALPGVANFILKALTRVIIKNGAVDYKPFRFRLGNSDGGTWYTAGGLGATTDRVMDSLIFGSGQFPFPLIPPIFYSANSSINFEIEDVSNSVPYTIVLGFHGSYLLPV